MLYSFFLIAAFFSCLSSCLLVLLFFPAHSFLIFAGVDVADNRAKRTSLALLCAHGVHLCVNPQPSTFDDKFDGERREKKKRIRLLDYGRPSRRGVSKYFFRKKKKFTTHTQHRHRFAVKDKEKTFKRGRKLKTVYGRCGCHSVCSASLLRRRTRAHTSTCLRDVRYASTFGRTHISVTTKFNLGLVRLLREPLPCLRRPPRLKAMPFRDLPHAQAQSSV